MAKPKRPRKPENKDSLPSEAERKTAKPKTADEQVQAIADDLKSEVISWIYRYTLEMELMKEATERALGKGGGKLEEFIQEFTSGYSRTVPGNDTADAITKDKDNRPELKQVSKEAKVDVILPQDKKGNVSKQSTRTTNKKR